MKRVYIHTILINQFQTSIQFSMKQYAVIHAVAGLFEGYSDTTCEFFPKRGFAEKHIKQLLDGYREDEMCVCIEHQDGGDAEVTMTRDYENYKACVPSDMSHDDYVAENGDDCSVEVFRIIELDMSNRSESTESCWLTWNQLEACEAWDYQPLCMSLVARVTSDVMDTTSDDYPTQALHNLAQLGDFVSSVYYRNQALIDVDDYVMHAFRIPKPKNSDSYDPSKGDLDEWMDKYLSFES